MRDTSRCSARVRAILAPALALSLGAVLLAAAPGDAIEVMPVVSEGQVSASFSAPSSFDANIQDVVRSGLLVTFTFTVELKQPSAIWMDHTLSTAVVASSVKYDNLTAVYQVSKLAEGRVVWSERTQDEAQMRSWMTKFQRVSLASHAPLEPNADYYVRVRMQASPKRTFSIWPWSGDSASGRADFTFIR